MGRQLDDPGFDPENDEWVGRGAGWDHQSLDSGSSGYQGRATFSTSQRAPSISATELRLILKQLDSGGLSMTHQKCLDELRRAGHSHLTLDHVALVAELSGFRSQTRDWTGVPASIRRSAANLGERRKIRKSRRR